VKSSRRLVQRLGEKVARGPTDSSTRRSTEVAYFENNQKMISGGRWLKPTQPHWTDSISSGKIATITCPRSSLDWREETRLHLAKFPRASSVPQEKRKEQLTKDEREGKFATSGGAMTSRKNSQTQEQDLRNRHPEAHRVTCNHAERYSRSKKSGRRPNIEGKREGHEGRKRRCSAKQKGG